MDQEREQNDSFDTLIKELKRTLKNLNLKRDALLQQETNLLDLSHTLSKTSEDTMVALGDGYFVSMSSKEAREFLLRRQQLLKTTVADIESQISMGYDTRKRFLELLQTKSEEKYNEEGLPFIEILEELDEDGNVISAKFSGKDESETSMARQLEPTTTINKIPPAQKDSMPIDRKKKGEQDKDIISEERNDNSEQQSQWDELMEDMGIKRKDESNYPADPANDVISQIDDVNANKGTNDIAIDQNEILKLELYDDLAAEEDLSIPDNIEWDYNFGSDDDDKDDDDSDDDEFADRILYGQGGASFIPSTKDDRNDINGLLWQQVSDYRRNKHTAAEEPFVHVSEEGNEEGAKPNNAKKSVRFSDTLDIKSIENVGQQLKQITYPSRKFSRFKQVRSANEKNQSNEISANEADLEVKTSESAPLSDVLERNFDEIKLQEQHDKPLSDILEHQTGTGDDLTIATSEANGRHPAKVRVSRFKSKSQKLGTQVDMSKNENDLPEPERNCPDLDELAKAYTQDLLKDDEEFSQRVVIEKLDDLEKHNSLVESNPEFLSDTNGEANADFVSDESDSDGDSGPILDDIVENDVVETEDIESSILHEQISREYEMLSKKFRPSRELQGKNQEIEHLDENHEPLRVSRFKSARYGQLQRN